MAAIEPSSLDRFLWERGVSIAGLSFASQDPVVGFGIAGGINFVVGSGFLISTLVANFPAEFGLSIAGAIMVPLGAAFLGTAAYLMRKRRSDVRTEVRLTGEGMKLLHKIMAHIGWTQNQYESYRTTWAGWTQWFGGPRTASAVLRPEAFEILDAAAFQYNRVAGVLKIKRASGVPTLERMAPSIQAAADEAIISIINQVAIMEKTPESAGALSKQIHHDHRQLRELADRVQNLAGGEGSLTDQYGSSSAMQSVLETLRLDHAARTELHATEKQELEERLRLPESE